MTGIISIVTALSYYSKCDVLHYGTIRKNLTQASANNELAINQLRESYNEKHTSVTLQRG